MKKCLQVLAILLLWVSFTLGASAYINPNFTPVDLIDQADIILSLEFTGIDTNGVAGAAVNETLKGSFSETTLEIDLYAGMFEEQGTSVKNQISGEQKSAMLFIGYFSADGVGADEAEAMGFLHIGNRWILLYRVEDALWELDKEEARLLGTWAGGTVMLNRAVHAALENPDIEFPVDAYRNWGDQIALGKTKGAVHGVQTVDLNGDGKVSLFITGEQGDRLFSWSKGSMAEHTAKLKLTSKSIHAAWGDFNKDGLTDLASWNGTALVIYEQKKDGTFSELACRKMDCLTLTTMDSGERLALIAGTKSGPVMLTLKADNTVEAKSLSASTEPLQQLFCADFDGDTLVDILELFPSHSLFYKGTAPGAFAPSVKIAPAAGVGKTGACIGDYDGDGLLDLCTVASDRNRIWQNQGGSEFVNTLDKAGEIYYIAKAGGVEVHTTDINNDGKQDIAIAYGQSFPKLFFNRGFRSFGQARSLDLAISKTLDVAGAGQQASCMGDFNCDGAQDMVLILADGTGWLLTRDRSNDEDLALFVSLSPDAPSAGPVTVTASQFDQPFGAHVLRAGQAPVFFGLQEPGPVILTWTLPGGDTQTREVIVENEPVYLFLDK